MPQPPNTPFIATYLLTTGLEAVIFVGGVSLGQPATAIPIAAIVGIICGLIVGYIIYTFASRTGELDVFQHNIFLIQISSEGVHGRDDKPHPPDRIRTL